MANSYRFIALVLCNLLLTVSVNAQVGGSSLSGLTGQQSRPTPLPLTEAFPYYVSELGEGRYRITWTPASGHYLYRHAFAFSFRASSNANPEPLSYDMPDGLPKTDQFFGDIQAYYDGVSAEISLPGAIQGGASLIIEYQGCADWGFCYPPQQQEFEILP